MVPPRPGVAAGGLHLSTALTGEWRADGTRVTGPAWAHRSTGVGWGLLPCPTSFNSGSDIGLWGRRIVSLIFRGFHCCNFHLSEPFPHRAVASVLLKLACAACAERGAERWGHETRASVQQKHRVSRPVGPSAVASECLLHRPGPRTCLCVRCGRERVLAG